MEKTIFAHHTAEVTCGLRWGAGAKTLCIAALSLVYSTPEYCAPVWCHSAHTCLIDVSFKSLLSVHGMKGRVSSGGYSNLGTQAKDSQKLMFSIKEKEF